MACDAYRLEITHPELANLSGSTRETVPQLENKNLSGAESCKVIIGDPESLRALS